MGAVVVVVVYIMCQNTVFKMCGYKNSLFLKEIVTDRLPVTMFSSHQVSLEDRGVYR